MLDQSRLVIKNVNHSGTPNEIVHVACNSDVIVVAQSTLNYVYSVFDMITGAIISSFGECGPEIGQIFRCYDTTLSFDGTKVLVAESGNHRVSMFSLNGTFLRTVGNAKTLGNVSGVVELPDGRVVVSDTGNRCLVIFQQSGEITVHKLGNELLKDNTGITYVRYANGYLFVARGTCIQCFT